MKVRLKQLRSQKGLTQKGAAKELGISISYVKKLEMGLQIPSLKISKRIAEFFGCETLDEIFINEAV